MATISTFFPRGGRLARKGCILALLLVAGGAWHPAHALSSLASPSDERPAGSTAEGNKGLLWKVERSGLRPSYVFGTLHSEDPRIVNLSPAVLRAFRFSDVFAMEMIPDHASLARMSAAMFISDGRDLKELLGESGFAQAVIVMNNYGIAPDVLIKLKPWVVFTVLTMPKPEKGMFLDMILYGVALSDGKYVHGLETADEQVAIFEDISMDDQVAILRDVIDHYAGLSEVNRELAVRYSQGNLGAVAALQDGYLATQDQRLIQSYRRHVFDERNLRIVERMVPRIEEQNAFIAIDAGLLPGEQGVLHLLEQRGYRISPVH